MMAGIKPGITLNELALALALASVILGVAVAGLGVVNDQLDRAQLLNDIDSLRAGVTRWMQSHRLPNTLSIQALHARRLINLNIIEADPWGGTYSLQVDYTTVQHSTDNEVYWAVVSLVSNPALPRPPNACTSADSYYERFSATDSRCIIRIWHGIAEFEGSEKNTLAPSLPDLQALPADPP